MFEQVSSGRPTFVAIGNDAYIANNTGEWEHHPLAPTYFADTALHDLDYVRKSVADLQGKDWSYSFTYGARTHR